MRLQNAVFGAYLIGIALVCCSQRLKESELYIIYIFYVKIVVFADNINCRERIQRLFEHNRISQGVKFKNILGEVTHKSVKFSSSSAYITFT